MSQMMVMQKEMTTIEESVNPNILENYNSISKQINNNSLKIIQKPVDVRTKEPIQSEPHQVLIFKKSRSPAIENIAT